MCPLLQCSWSACFSHDIILHEQVQKCFTRRLRGLRLCLYDKQQQLLNLQKVETCWLQQDLIWCYRILLGCININPDKFEFLVTTTSGHPYKSYKHYSFSGTRACFFHRDAVDLKSLFSFKRTLNYCSCYRTFRFLAWLYAICNVFS